MAKNDTRQLTSVKVDIDTFNSFKVECIHSKFSIQKLVDRAMFLYLTNEDFKSTLHNCNELEFKK